MAQDALASALRTIPNFPRAGILFRDIGPVLADGQLFREATRLMLERGGEADLYGGIESRGLVFAAAMATRAERGLVMIRKHGKLPPPVQRREYTLEYGTDTLEMAPCPTAGTSLLLVDDLLATGGTLGAAAMLATQAGYRLVGAVVLIALTALHEPGFRLPGNQPIRSVLSL